MFFAPGDRISQESAQLMHTFEEKYRGLVHFSYLDVSDVRDVVRAYWLALEKGVGSRYVEFMLLLSEIKAGFDANRSHMDILRPLLSVPVLAIDELGKERGTEWERSMLDELISRRFNSGLATLFATNYFLEPRPPAEEPGRVHTRSREFQRDAEAMTLAQRVGDRIYSRLNEMCSFVKLDPGHDLRKDRHGAGSGGFWG